MEQFFKRILEKKKPLAETKFPRIDSYEYFMRKDQRHDIYEFSKELTEYLAKNEVKNIMFLDRAARPAFYGMHEYWKEHFPDRQMPQAYFINPDAFPENLQEAIAIMSFTGNDVFSDVKEAAREEGMQFAHLYARLEKDKTAPLVVFDTCSHTGRHLIPVLAMLSGRGFTDVRTLTAHKPDYVSPIVTAKRLDRKIRLRHGHYPFGYGDDSMVKKGKVLVSERNEHAHIQQGIQVRNEIRQIIRDKGK